MRCAFAYGSAVFRQHTREKGKMLDLIFAVDDAELWHAENMKTNWHHYSFLRRCGSDVVAKVQRAGGGVYYNTLVEIDSQVVKYGVICIEDLLDDLLKWKWLYISGRLQKPVVFLTDVHAEPDLNEAVTYNLSSAACCAVLMMEDDVPFTCSELFSTVAGLSYKGDFRMFVGEDKKKVTNIVRGSLTEFQDLYSPFLTDLVDYLPDNKMIKKVGITVESCQDHLPEVIQQSILHGESLQSALTRIVRRSSIQQSLKGILTAG
jgi:translocator assembly and maintenance protein 41